jgi:hypothetical protein
MGLGTFLVLHDTDESQVDRAQDAHLGSSIGLPASRKSSAISRCALSGYILISPNGAMNRKKHQHHYFQNENRRLDRKFLAILWSSECTAAGHRETRTLPTLGAQSQHISLCLNHILVVAIGPADEGWGPTH